MDSGARVGVGPVQVVDGEQQRLGGCLPEAPEYVVEPILGPQVRRARRATLMSGIGERFQRLADQTEGQGCLHPVASADGTPEAPLGQAQRVLQHRGLAQPGITDDEQHATLPVRGAVEQLAHGGPHTGPLGDRRAHVTLAPARPGRWRRRQASAEIITTLATR